LYNSRNNDPIKKNDIFIKNYFDQAKYSDKRNFYYPKNDYYGITYKSLSNKKINSNDVIDRGYLCNFEYNITDEKKKNKNINEVSEIKNKMESNKNDYDYISVFELETLNSYNIEPENRNPNEYVMTEALDNSTDVGKIENIYINDEKYFYNTCDLKLNNRIYI